MKTYVLTVSRTFPKTHKRAGEETYFPEQLKNGIYDGLFLLKPNGIMITEKKFHTIRSNYSLWLKRISEIQKGNAVLSIRYWSEKPYNSKQIEICQLDKDSGCGLQKLNFVGSSTNGVDIPIIELVKGTINTATLAKNDGLSLEDFKEWFKCYDLSQTMAIIHFTSFRY